MKGGTPKLVCGNHAMPVFYRDVMCREDAEEKMGRTRNFMTAMTEMVSGSVSSADMEYLRKY